MLLGFMTVVSICRCMDWERLFIRCSTDDYSICSIILFYYQKENNISLSLCLIGKKEPVSSPTICVYFKCRLLCRYAPCDKQYAADSSIYCQYIRPCHLGLLCHWVVFSDHRPCGFHPLVSLALLVSMMAPVIHELPALPIAIMLIVAGTSTVMFSPFNVSVSLLADLMKVNPYRITRWNIWFASLYISMGIACAAIITVIFYT